MAWDSNVKLALMFENNNTDDTGNYTQADVGTPIYNNTIYKQGAYAFQNFTDWQTCGIQIDNNTITDISSYDNFTVEFWFYHKDSESNYAILFSKGESNPLNSGFMWAYTDKTDGKIHFRWNGAEYLIAFNTYNTWQHWSVQWEKVSGTSGTVKVYINQTLVLTANSVENSLGAQNANFRTGSSFYGGTLKPGSLIDKFIISDIARNGAETMPLPDVTSCTPDSGSTAGGTAVTIAGANFTGATGVTFGGDAATSVSVVSDISITCVTPAHAAGAVDVVVTTSAGSGTLTNGFTYINPAPTVTSITPTSGLIFGGTTTTITGTGFTNATAVTFGGLNAASYTVDSATTITAVTPAHAVGLVDVAITTAYGTATLSAGFEYRTPVLFKPTNDYIITVNNIDISQTQTAKFKESQELNIIENYDYALDGVEAEMPLEFAAQLRGADPVCVYNLKGEKRFKGYVSAKQFNYKSRKLGIKALPLTDYLNKSIAAFDESSASPAAHINNILNAYLPSEYKTGNIVSQSQKLQGISVSLDTDDAEINVKSIINSLCENYDIGLYNDGLNIRAYAVPNRFPRVGIDINNYLIELPLITEITDYFCNKVNVKHETAAGAGEATATAGSGDLVSEFSLSDTYCTAAVAQKIAERKLDIYGRTYYIFEAPVIISLPLKISNYFIYDGYIFVLTAIQTEKTKYIIKGWGVKL